MLYEPGCPSTVFPSFWEKIAIACASGNAAFVIVGQIAKLPRSLNPEPSKTGLEGQHLQIAEPRNPTSEVWLLTNASVCDNLDRFNTVHQEY